MSVKKVLLPKLHTSFAQHLSDLLHNGEVIEVDGLPLVIDGVVQRRKPSAPILNVIRQFLKDNGIDSEASEASPIVETQKALRSYDDDPLVIPERDGIKQIQ